MKSPSEEDFPEKKHPGKLLVCTDYFVATAKCTIFSGLTGPWKFPFKHWRCPLCLEPDNQYRCYDFPNKCGGL